MMSATHRLATHYAETGARNPVDSAGEIAPSTSINQTIGQLSHHVHELASILSSPTAQEPAHIPCTDHAARYLYQQNPSYKDLLTQTERKALESKKPLSSNLASSLVKKAAIYDWAQNVLHFLKKNLSEDLKSLVCNAIVKGDLKSLATALFDHLDPMDPDTPVAAFCSETKELLLKDSKHPVDELFTHIMFDRTLSEALERVREIKREMKAVQKSPVVALRTHRIAQIVLQLSEEIHKKLIPSSFDAHFGNMIDWTHRASVIGTMKQACKKIEARRDAIVRSIHHQKKNPAVQRRISSIMCRHGGGHGSMVAATKPYLETPTERHRPYHFSVEQLDLPTATRKYTDPVFQLTSKLGLKDKDAPWLFNWLLRNDHCKVYMFLKKLGLGNPDEATIQKTTRIVRRALLQAGSDLAAAYYTFDYLYIDRASKQLGLPMIHIHTDLDNSGWETPPTNPHFRMMSQSKTQPTIARTRGDKTRDAQVVEIGLPVGYEFEREISTAEIQELKQQIGIQDDRPIVIFSNGANGTISPFPAHFVQNYHGEKVALVVVCGKNETFKSYLEKKLVPQTKKNPSVQLIPLGFQDKTHMSRLLKMASCVVGKPGGLTTMETMKSGSYFIGDETKSRFPWESDNMRVLEECHMGSSVSRLDQLIPTIEARLRERHVRPPFAEISASRHMYQAVEEVQQEAEQDPAFMARKKAWHTFSKEVSETFR